MKALIVGLGSAGSYLAEYLVKEGLEVHGTSRKLYSNLKYQIHQCDLNDFSVIFQLIKKIKPYYIFNLASYADVRYSFDSSLSVVQNNVGICLNLLEAIKLSEIDCKIQHCGTSEIYKNNIANKLIDENFPIGPSNLYSISKLTQEQICNYYYQIYNQKIIISRAFSYINPRRSNIFSSAFAKQIVDIECGKKDKLKHGYLGSIRSLCDIRDICHAYWLTITKCNIGEVYNIGSTIPISVAEFLEKLKLKTKKKIKCELDKKLLRHIDISYQVPNIDKFKQTTGWEPKISLDESIDWLLEEYRKAI